MNLAKVISIIAISSSKFVWGIAAVLFLDCTFLEAFLYTSIGGTLGVLFYLFLFDLLFKYSQKKIKKSKINKFRRFMIKVKQSGGLWGIAMLSPVLFSIPIGIAISVSLQSPKRKIILAHCTSVIFWSALFVGLKYTIGWNLGDQI